MKIEGRRRSSNVEDRRGRGAGGKVAAGGGIATLVIAVVVMLLGGDPSEVINSMPQESQPSGPAAPRPAAEDALANFASVILADTEETWPALLSPLGVRYEEPRMVLFTDAVDSGCGFAQSAMGPFYCPADHRVYLDVGFFADLEREFQAPGDFAAAYVIAHEVGHHVQTLLGVSAQVDAQRRRVSEVEANALSVRQELQADCFAGIWAHHAQKERQLLEAGDVEEGLRAAAAIGDDTLQRRGRGHVVPESFTHGSSAQRVEWFKRGMETGSVKACDTFGL